MDDPTAVVTVDAMARIAEGFPNQIHLVLPPTVAATALRQPITRDLLPTAFGYFPAAAGHYISRRGGAPDHIVILCVAGGGWIETGGSRKPLHAGEVCVLPPRVPHRYGAGRSAWTIYWAHFTGRQAADYAGLIGDTGAGPVRLAATGPAVAAMETLLRIGQRGYGRVELLSLSTGFAAWFGHLQHLRAEALASRGNASTRVLGAESWLRARLAERITVAEMAHAAGLSPSHFSALFRDRFGYSPLDFHLRCRVQRACELLVGSDFGVTAAAAAVGFADPLYFSRVFRRVMGEPPTAYAMRHRVRR